MKVPGISYMQGINSYKDRDGKHFGWAIHATANTASDTGEALYATRRTDGTSSHFYHDKDSVTQSLDTDAKAGHAGSDHGNENGLASEFTGLNSWTRATWLTNVDWEETGKVIAYVLRNEPDFAGFQIRRATVAEMVANPKIKAFYAHDDMRRAWGGTTHTDPGPNFPWDKFLDTVKKYMGGEIDMGDIFCQKGDTGSAVRSLQLGLNRAWKGEEDYNGKDIVVVDGSYGDATCNAVADILGGPDAGTPYHPELYYRLLEKLTKLWSPEGPKGDKGDDGEKGDPGEAAVLQPGDVLKIVRPE